MMDAPREIVGVLPGQGWKAQLLDGRVVPVIGWAVYPDGDVFPITTQADGPTGAPVLRADLKKIFHPDERTVDLLKALEDAKAGRLDG